MRIRLNHMKFLILNHLHVIHLHVIQHTMFPNQAYFPLRLVKGKK